MIWEERRPRWEQRTDCKTPVTTSTDNRWPEVTVEEATFKSPCEQGSLQAAPRWLHSSNHSLLLASANIFQAPKSWDRSSDAGRGARPLQLSLPLHTAGCSHPDPCKWAEEQGPSPSSVSSPEGVLLYELDKGRNQLGGGAMPKVTQDCWEEDLTRSISSVIASALRTELNLFRRSESWKITESRLTPK